jgi:TetR/AcrR family transcriptional regulator, transcriptional repressor of aconitase
MQDIFAASGLSAGAVYRYFPSKTELVRAIAAEALAHALPALDGAAAATGVPDVLAALVTELRGGRLARLRPVILQVWAEVVRDPQLAELARSTLRQLLTRITAVLEQLASRGQLPRGTDTAAAARLILAALQGYVIQFAVFGDVLPEEVRAAAETAFGGRCRESR